MNLKQATDWTTDKNRWEVLDMGNETNDSNNSVNVPDEFSNESEQGMWGVRMPEPEAGWGSMPRTSVMCEMPRCGNGAEYQVNRDGWTILTCYKHSANQVVLGQSTERGLKRVASSKVARKSYTQWEKRALIDENGYARNFHKLNLANSHYESLDSASILFLMPHGL